MTRPDFRRGDGMTFNHARAVIYITESYLDLGWGPDPLLLLELLEATQEPTLSGQMRAKARRMLERALERWDGPINLAIGNDDADS